MCQRVGVVGSGVAGDSVAVTALAASGQWCFYCLLLELVPNACCTELGSAGAEGAGSPCAAGLGWGPTAGLGVPQLGWAGVPRLGWAGVPQLGLGSHGWAGLGSRGWAGLGWGPTAGLGVPWLGWGPTAGLGWAGLGSHGWAGLGWGPAAGLGVPWLGWGPVAAFLRGAELHHSSRLHALPGCGLCPASPKARPAGCGGGDGRPDAAVPARSSAGVRPGLGGSRARPFAGGRAGLTAQPEAF